ncbi:MAG: polysaccharide biosynthesis protein GumN, partial [Mesorhizobium sp.]
MKRVIAIADRAALVSLKLLAALNLLFLLSFLIFLLLASRAHAEAPNCAGTDLLTALEK